MNFEEIWYRGGAALRMGAKSSRDQWGVWLELAGAIPGDEHVIPPAGGQKYDWAHKLAFRLSRLDLGKLGWALQRGEAGELVTLIHRYQGRSKRLQLVRAANGVVFVNGDAGAAESRIALPLDGEGAWRFAECLRLAYHAALQRTAFISEDGGGG
jgi:hypothetical protein